MSMFLIQHVEGTDKWSNSEGEWDLERSDIELEEPFRVGNHTIGCIVERDDKLRAYITGRYRIRQYRGLVSPKPPQTRQLVVHLCLK